MNIKAIWIIDENYILPAYISISSFLKANEISISVVYCGEERLDEAKSLFTSLSPLIQFDTFNIPKEYEGHPRKSDIANRLARMYYAKKSEEEVVLLLDGDIVFTQQGDQLIQSIKEEISENESAIIGVLDAKVAFRDFLYFNTKDKNGRDNVVSHFEQNDIYAKVFGEKWWYLLRGPSINNGVVAFYNCKEAIQAWEEFYLEGLKYKEVNPGDDQLPLAGAIEKTSQKIIRLPERFNSKGKVDGEYIVYHAFSSIWKRQVFSAIKGHSGVSDFAELVKNNISNIPSYLLDEFVGTIDQKEPYLYRRIEGKFGFKHLYEDILTGIERGTFVEVGMKTGKSTCFMIEQIKSTGKDIQFFVVADIVKTDNSIRPIYDFIDHFSLKDYAEFVQFSECPSISTLASDIDFVFLNLDNDYEAICRNLEFWYSRVKPGGILAGYDYTSQIGLKYGNKCATYDFCQKRNLSLRISFNIFIIEKPTISEFSKKPKLIDLVLQESNEKG